MSWTSAYTLGPDQYFEITLRYTRQGSEVVLPVYVQVAQWFVDPALYLEADQETNRAYHWRVRAVLKVADAAGKVSYVPLSTSSEEQVFYWQ